MIGREDIIMKTKAAKRAIRKIAKREGITECEVRKEMEKAIMIGFMNTGTRQKWNDMFGARKLPSPEEFITKVSGMMAK